MTTDAGEEVHGYNNERMTSADATIAAGGHQPRDRKTTNATINQTKDRWRKGGVQQQWQRWQ